MPSWPDPCLIKSLTDRHYAKFVESASVFREIKVSYLKLTGYHVEGWGIVDNTIVRSI